MGRRAIEVKKSLLQKIIKECEKDGALPNQSALYKLVAERYNEEKSIPEEINPTVVGLRINDWEIKIKTVPGKKGRATVEINKDDLQNSINAVEEDNEFSTMQEFYSAVLAHYNENYDSEVNISVIINRITTWELSHKTQKGKKGKPPVDIDRETLESVLKKLEANGAQSNMTKFFEAMMEEYNLEVRIEKRVKSWVTLKKRLEEWGINSLTVQKNTRGPKEETVEIDNSGSAIVPRKFNHDHIPRDEKEGHLFAKAFGGRKALILAPAGGCPVKLKGTDTESVQNWFRLVVEAGHNRGVQLAPCAIRYHLRDFYSMDSDEYKQAVEEVNQITSMIMSGVVVESANEPLENQDDLENAEEYAEVG